MSCEKPLKNLDVVIISGGARGAEGAGGTAPPLSGRKHDSRQGAADIVTINFSFQYADEHL